MSSRIVAGLAVGFLLTIAGGCVSKGSYQRIEEENSLLLTEMATLKAENARLRDTLNSRQMKSIGGLEDQLLECGARVEDTKTACTELTRKAEEAGFYMGAAEFNASLQVSGFPRSDGWWIFASHYYEFQVRLRDEVLYSQIVETEHEQPPLQQSLALVSELTRVMNFKG